MTAPAPYLTPAQVRRRRSDLVESEFPNELLTDLVAEFETDIERARGCAFTTRTETETRHLPAGCRSVKLAHPLVQAISSITVDGTPIDHTVAEIVGPYRNRLICPGLAGEVVITYTHGFTTTPPKVRRACALWVWHEAQSDANPTPGNSYMTARIDQGGATVVNRTSTPDWAANRFTGYIDVDKLINQLFDYRPIGLG